MRPDIIQPIVDAAVGGLAWLIPLILVIGALKLLYAVKVKGWIGEKLVASRISELGTAVLNDIIIPDGKGGRERDRQWTQRLGHKSL